MYAFKDDEDISRYCDPKDKDLSTKELVQSIYEKLLEYDKTGECEFYDLMVDDILVGYGANYKNILVSFGVNKMFRKKEKLEKVFEIIKSKFNGNFESYMWERNERAVNWLIKCGMNKIESNIENAIKLVYICH